MPAYFQRPENALKRANEFMDVGKRQRALETLSDVIKSKRHRTWQKVHEPIMQKYLQLCVELRKSHIAKEGLYQYKNICQQVNIASLVDVVRCYIQLAEERTEAAREKSHQKVVDVDDLDLPDSPESILLKAVSGEDTQDRTDRAILTPWVKFLWESYRQCLDLLRNNSRVERLYQDIAQQAFKFCLKYARKTEFRKLCDNLRTHLGHIHKHQHQQTAINLNNPDSQAMHLETRLVQLDSAINMELWQEAFKAVEDIHGLISLSKKPPRPSLMANYYQKLGLVFWKSGNRLFHASTLHRLYHLSREQRKNLATEELTQMASRVLCATLAVQIPPSRNAIGELLEMNESTMEKKRHLATLLMLPNPPTRQGLIKDLVKHNVIQNVYPELQNLYRWLEVDFHPLSLYKRVTTPLDIISKNDELSQYVPALEDIVITRVLKQVSQVYQTIEFARLASLVPFATQFRLERVIVDAKKTLELQVRINHQTRSLSFGTNLDVAQREDVPEGPYIQSMPSEQIRNQLTEMARSLHKALTFIVPHEKQVERDNLKVKIMGEYRTSAKREHTKILQRRQIIEDRKEQLEHFNDQREKEEMEEMEAQKSKAYEEEMARLEREVEERKKHRAVLEHQEIKRKHVKERIEQLRKSEMGSKFLENFDEEDIADLDVDEIMQKQVEQLEKEKKELNERLKLQERKVDHIVRAQRLEELPLLEKKIEENQVEAKAFWEKQEKERIENLIEERKHALETKNRLRRIKEDKDLFMEKLQDTRTSEYEDKLAEFQTLLKKERQKRLQERKEKRKIERREKWYKEREEERQRIRDEQMLREREAKEAEERARREEEEKEYEEKYKRLQEQAEKQRLREQEIEEKLKQKQSDKHPAASPEQRNIRIKPGDSEREPDTWRRGQREMRDEDPNEKKAWRPAPKEGGGWREREKERENSWKKEPSRGEDEPSTWRKHEGGGGWREREAERAPRDDRDFDRGPREDRDERGWRRDEERGPKRDFGRDERGPRDYRRDDRGPRDFDRDDRGPRDFGRDDRGPRDFGRDDRGPRDFGRDDRGPRDFGRDDRGPRDFGRDDRGPRDFERDDRGPRDLGRDDRGPRDFGRDDRGPRDFGRDDRGPRDFGRDDRGSRDFRRDDRGPRDFGRDDRGPRRDFGREDRSPREEQGSWRGGGGGRRDDEATPRRDGGGAWRATPRASEEGGGWRSRMAAKEGGERPTQAASKGDESVGRKEEDGWTVVTK